MKSLKEKFKTCPVKLFTMFNLPYLTWNFYFTRIMFLAMILFGFLGVAKNSLAANIYVDQTLSSNCTSGDYSTSNQSCLGNDGDGYITIQEAVNDVQPGDTIYMRGGTYHETSINLDGKSGEENAWITFKSYPGEWAIIDGQHNSFENIFEYTWSGTISRYWKFENFEVTGAGIDDVTGNSAAFYFQGVTDVEFKYMYIHDNYGSGSGRAQGISFSHQPTGAQNIVIKYSYFKDNGCLNSPNCAHITFFSDYVENPLNVDFLMAVHDNEISYNIFEGAAVGVHYKNSQYLCIDDHTATNMEHKNNGDKIHHNIFINQKLRPMQVFQDFIQVYNNIMYSSIIGNPFTIGGQSEDDREPFYAVVYNNLFKQIKVGLYHDGNNGGIDDNSNYVIPDEHLGRPFFYFYNNIIENTGPLADGKLDLNILFSWHTWDVNDIDMSTVHTENNLFYPRDNTDDIIIVGDDLDRFTASEFLSAGYANELYVTSTSGLHPDGENFKVNSDFVIGASTTIANGGVDIQHPYLSGISIPSYVGAVNPDDDDWVDGVLGLASVSYLTNAPSGDPNWVEGGSTQPDTIAPSHPTGLSVS